MQSDDTRDMKATPEEQLDMDVAAAVAKFNAETARINELIAQFKDEFPGSVFLTRPLPPGSVVDYCGERGVVVYDDGGDRIEVDCDGYRQNWYWEFEGVSCTIISTLW